MRMHCRALVVLLAVSSCGLGQAPNEQKFYGEPVRLWSKFIYFTSWKYVRQGNFRWAMEKLPASQAAQLQGQWLEGDGMRPAAFTTVDMPRGIRLVAQPAEKVPHKPGQRAASVFDDGKYKVWYTVPACEELKPQNAVKMLPGHDSYVAYAESVDGETWTTPDLGIYPCKETRNIVFRSDLTHPGRGMGHAWVFIDPSSTQERFKMLYLGLITDEEWAAFEKKYPGEVDTMARRPDIGGLRCVFAVFGAVSPDGLHWTSLDEPLAIQHADTINTCYYDVDLKKYVAYFRAWQVNERIEGQSADSTTWIDVGRRSIGRSVSSDFRHFSKAELVVTTGADMPPNHVYYTNGKTTLPGCPDNHVMFPWLWELDSDGGSTWLLSSADGWTWSKVPGGPVVTTGKVGTSDGAFVLCGGNLLEYPGDRWAVPYGGVPIPHKYPGRDITKRKGLFPGVKSIDGLAVWPKGRLVALQCDDEGEFATVCVAPPGESIRLNASVKPSGYIQVAVRAFGTSNDIPDRSFTECDRLIGDSLAMPVTWKGDKALNHKGQPISLRFKLRQASLFGIEFY